VEGLVAFLTIRRRKIVMEEKDSKQLSWLMIALIAFNIVWGWGMLSIILRNKES